MTKDKMIKIQKRKIALAALLAASICVGCSSGAEEQTEMIQESQTETETEAAADNTAMLPVETTTEESETTIEETATEETKLHLETTLTPETAPTTESSTAAEAVLQPTKPPVTVETKSTEVVYDGTAEDQFFFNSVFVGDSVMMGFRNYVLNQEEGFLGNPQFLVSGSFSARMALQPVSSTSIHPVYQGEQHPIWESMSMMGVEKVFLFFGLNDIGVNNVDGTYENYMTLFDQIYAANPDISIYVISTTNMYAGSEKATLNNENIRLLNDKMEAYCADSRESFINIADYLIDESGCLRPEYCSDEYVHQNAAAYEIWTQVLRGFAQSQQAQETKKEGMPEENLPEETPVPETLVDQ